MGTYYPYDEEEERRDELDWDSDTSIDYYDLTPEARREITSLTRCDECGYPGLAKSGNGYLRCPRCWTIYHDESGPDSKDEDEYDPDREDDEDDNGDDE